MRLRFLLIAMCIAISMIPVSIIWSFEGFQIATAFLGLILVVTFFVSFVMSYFITLPLEKLTKNIDEISKGNLEVHLEKSEIYEINKLTSSLDRVMASLKLAIHKVGVKKGEIFEKTVKAMQEAEEKYESLINVMDDWICETDRNGVCTYCSPKISENLGFDSSELIGKKIYNFINLEDSKKVKNLYLELDKTKNKNLEKVEIGWNHKNGNTIFFSFNYLPIFDKNNELKGIRAILKNMSDYKFAEEKIGELNEKLKDMKERMRDILNEKEKENVRNTKEFLTEKEFDYMFIFNENAKIIDFSENLPKKLGYKKEELHALDITDFDFLETNENLKKEINRIKKEGSANLKTIHKKKDGSSIFVTENIEFVKDKNVFKCLVKEEKI